MTTTVSSPGPPELVIMTQPMRSTEPDDIYTLLQTRISLNNRTLQQQTESVLYAPTTTTTTTNPTTMTTRHANTTPNQNCTTPHPASRHVGGGAAASFSLGPPPDQSHSVAASRSSRNSKKRDLGSLWWTSHKSRGDDGGGSSVSSLSTFTTQDSRAQQQQRQQQVQRETARRMAHAYQKGQEQMALRRWMAQSTKQQGLATRREWMEKSRAWQQSQRKNNQPPSTAQHPSEEREDNIRGRQGQGGGESGIAVVSSIPSKSQSTNTTTERRRSLRMPRRGSTGTAATQSTSNQAGTNSPSPSPVIGTSGRETTSASWSPPQFINQSQDKHMSTCRHPDGTGKSTNNQTEYQQEDAPPLPVPRTTRKMTRRGSTGNLPPSNGTMVSSPSSLAFSNAPNGNNKESSSALLLDPIRRESADMGNESHKSESPCTPELPDETSPNHNSSESSTVTNTGAAAISASLVLGDDETTISLVQEDMTTDPPTFGLSAAADGTSNRADETVEISVAPSSVLTEKPNDETNTEEIAQHSSREVQTQPKVFGSTLVDEDQDQFYDCLSIIPEDQENDDASEMPKSDDPPAIPMKQSLVQSNDESATGRPADEKDDEEKEYSIAVPDKTPQQDTVVSHKPTRTPRLQRRRSMGSSMSLASMDSQSSFCSKQKNSLSQEQTSSSSSSRMAASYQKGRDLLTLRRQANTLLRQHELAHRKAWATQARRQKHLLFEEEQGSIRSMPSLSVRGTDSVHVHATVGRDDKARQSLPPRRSLALQPVGPL